MDQQRRKNTECLRNFPTNLDYSSHSKINVKRNENTGNNDYILDEIDQELDFIGSDFVLKPYNTNTTTQQQEILFDKTL